MISFYTRGSYSDLRIYAQRFNSDGSRRWGVEDVFFATLEPSALYYYAPRIVSDGSHGAIVAYNDRPSIDGEVLYLKLINEDGELGVPKNSLPPPVDPTEAPLLGIQSIYPNPSTGIADIEFIVPVKGAVTVVVYNAIGEVVLIPHKELVQRDVTTSVSIDLTAQSSGAYYCRLTGPYIDHTKMLILQR